MEAYREAQVRAALAGIPDVYYWKPDAIKLVPLGQMTSVVAVRSERAAFAKGQFVRLNRGHYKGDLAQVRAAAAVIVGWRSWTRRVQTHPRLPPPALLPLSPLPLSSHR